MARKPKPHVHGRDHEHGGADTTLIHYDDVGDSGGGGGGTGIRYHVENEGDWLHIVTQGPPDDTGDPRQLFLQDLGNGDVGSGVYVSEAGDGAIWIENSGLGAPIPGHGATVYGIRINNDSPGLLQIHTSGDGGLDIVNDGDGPLRVRSTGAGGIEIGSFGGPITIDSGGGGVTIDGTPFP